MIDLSSQLPSQPLGRRLAVYAGVAILFFGALAPTLSWPEFSGDSEDNLVKTVLEIRNGGPWWVPTLLGVPRTRKPPLATWASAAAVTHSTMQGLNSADPPTRQKAYRALAFEVRWPAVAAAALTLVFVALLADLLTGASTGAIAAAMAGTTLLFLRFDRSATTDVWLTLFVAATNYFLALALVGGQRRTGMAAAGVSLGLAIMSKGPPALVETVAPALFFIAYERFYPFPTNAPGKGRWSAAVLLGVACFLAVALPWPVSAVLQHPESLHDWLHEATAERGVPSGEASWFAYVTLIPHLLPWLAFVTAGAWIAWGQRRLDRGLAFALCFFLTPILILCFFKDRKERYLMPMIAPAAVLGALAALRAARRDDGQKIDWLGAEVWGTLLVIGVGLPLTEAFFLKTSDGHPWLPIPLALGSIIVGIAFVALAVHQSRRHSPASVLTGAAWMLLLNALFLWGWSRSDSGQSEMKPIADRILAWSPAAKVYYYEPIPKNKPVTMDLDIYLNATVLIVPTPPADPAPANTAMVALQRAGDPVPQIAGYRLLFDQMRRKHRWYVFVPAD